MHLKRLNASKNYQIPRKISKFVVAPRAGPHGKDRCVPFGVFLRDQLGLAKTLSEAKKALSKGDLLVDGRVIKDYKYPLGLMDIVSIPKMSTHYRILLIGGKLAAREINEKEASFKLCRIIGKKHIHGGKIQFGFHDGRVFIMGSGKAVSDKTEKAVYNVCDVLAFSLPDQKIKSHLPMKAGNIAMITGGKHVGAVGKIKEVQIINNPEPNMVVMDIGGSVVRTLRDYIFIVGKDKPLIKLE
ncbi:MAG: 30S ribosomal protein S4e [archaeon]|nr:30S ribosomal protein S4e [archaeon]